MTYRTFIEDLSKIELYKDNQKFLEDTLIKLNEPLSRDSTKLMLQLTDAERRRAKLVYILAVAKAERDRFTAAAWRSRGTIRHGESKQTEMLIADEVKEYYYLVKLVEGWIECIDIRLPLGKKLLEFER